MDYDLKPQTMKDEPEDAKKDALEERMTPLNQKVQEVQNIMKQNMVNILQRGENLSELEDKTKSLEEGANVFKQTSQNVSRAYKCKNVKLIVIITVVVVLLVIVLIILLVTGVIPTEAPVVPTVSPTAKP